MVIALVIKPGLFFIPVDPQVSRELHWCCLWSAMATSAWATERRTWNHGTDQPPVGICFMMQATMWWYGFYDRLAESQKPPGLLSIGADEGVRIHILSGRAYKTYVKLIWNIDFYVGGTYVMRMWSVCAAQVKTYVSRMWNICETYAKYMWHINVFWNWIALCLCFTYVYVCEFMCYFYVGGKIRPYFVQITQNKALFWNARKENINITQTRTQTHFVTFVFVHVYMVYVLFMSGEK